MRYEKNDEHAVEFENKLIDFFRMKLGLRPDHARSVFYILKEVDEKSNDSVLAIEKHQVLLIERRTFGHRLVAVIYRHNCWVSDGEDAYGRREIIDIRPVQIH